MVCRVSAENAEAASSDGPGQVEHLCGVLVRTHKADVDAKMIEDIFWSRVRSKRSNPL